MSSTLRRGFSDEIGSWKIICMRGADLAQLLARAASVRSVPSNVHRARRSARGSCMIALPVVDLPQPDSPTRPSVSPAHHVEADVRDRVHLQAGAPDRELDDEVLDAQQRPRRRSRRCAVPLPAIRPPSRARDDGAACAAAPACPAAVSPAARLRVERVLSRPSVPTGKKHRNTWPGVVAVRERRLLGEALRLRVRAARRELAAGRRVDEVGRAAADRVEPGVARLRELRDRLQQRLGVRMPHLR